MWTPVNPNALPSQKEVTYTKNAIHELEMAIKDNLEIIEQAKVRINALKKEIQMRHAWIAPVRKLPTEILAEIFVYCSSLSRLAPVTIGQVCRFWRQVVLATPQAWCLIFLRPEMKDKDEFGYLPLFFARSKPYLVHIWTFKDPENDYDGFFDQIYFRPSTFMMAHLDRISCLTVDNLEVKRILEVVFPNLIRLEITESTGDAFPLNRVCFPSLLYLDCHKCTLDPGPGGTEYPPLQYLSFRADPYRRWVQIVNSCSSSLRAFAARRGFANSDVTLPVRFVFPVLTYLSLENWPDSNELSFMLRAITPKLVSYEEINPSRFSVSLHDDVKHVLHLRTNNTSQLANYSSLRFLQLSVLFSHDRDLLQLYHLFFRDQDLVLMVDNLVKPLREDPTICPALEAIEVFTTSEEQAIWKKIKDDAKEKVQTPRPWIKLSFVDRPSALPGSLEDFQCKHGISRK